MGIGIMVCGLNGCGKSTLGKALAQELGFRFIDNEYLFFSRIEMDEPYTNPRSRYEAEKLFAQEVREHDNFVFAAVTGDYAKNIDDLYQYVILIDVPKELCMQRVRNRSFMKFGKRMLQGGDLYESEEAFFEFVDKRPEDHVQKWVETLKCPIIRVDGTKSIEENIDFIKWFINNDTEEKSAKKPEFLYHGSQYLFDILEPQQASGANPQESQKAIYAGTKFEHVIPFALPIRWYPDNPSGKRAFSCEVCLHPPQSKTFLEYGSLDPNGIGYVYKVKSDSFTKIDDWQWVSPVAVVPEEVITIKVSDYINTVVFSEDAKEIQKKLYL